MRYIIIAETINKKPRYKTGAGSYFSNAFAIAANFSAEIAPSQ